MSIIFVLTNNQGSARPEVQRTVEPYGGVYPPSSHFLVHPHDAHHYPTADGQAETDRTDLSVHGHRLRTTLAQGLAQCRRPHSCLILGRQRADIQC